jgi:hypothetical protein
MLGENTKYIQNLVEKQGKGPLQMSRYGWDDNTKINVDI